MSKTASRVAALLAMVALTLPVMAKPVSKFISISQPAKVGNAQLSAGDYRLLIDGDKVTIQKGKEIIATVNGRWEERDKKSETDSVVIGSNGDLQEVRFAGNHRVLILGGQ